MNGLSDEQAEQSRLGFANDVKTQAGLKFAKEVTRNRGQVSSEAILAGKQAS